LFLAYKLSGLIFVGRMQAGAFAGGFIHAIKPVATDAPAD